MLSSIELPGQNVGDSERRIIKLPARPHPHLLYISLEGSWLLGEEDGVNLNFLPYVKLSITRALMKSFSIGISITCTARIRRTSKSTSGLLRGKHESITDDQNVLGSASVGVSEPQSWNKLNSVTYYVFTTRKWRKCYSPRLKISTWLP